MSPESPLPVLPSYDPPVEKPKAEVPNGIELKKMPGIMNKMISRMLPKLGKLKMPKHPKARLPKTKLKKLKPKKAQKP